MKSFVGASMLMLCLGCSESTTGPAGLQQDDLAKYVAENPDVDASRSMGTEVAGAGKVESAPAKK